jgi:hypothetical protein
MTLVCYIALLMPIVMIVKGIAEHIKDELKSRERLGNNGDILGAFF